MVDYRINPWNRVRCSRDSPREVWTGFWLTVKNQHKPVILVRHAVYCLRYWVQTGLQNRSCRVRLLDKALMRSVHAPTPCLKCGQLAVNMGRCQDHQLPAWQGSTRRSRLPSDWNTRRLIVLKRDKGICYVCGGPNADAVDHLIAGDDHSLGNLKAIHDHVEPHCHREKSTREGIEAKAGNKIKPRH